MEYVLLCTVQYTLLCSFTAVYTLHFFLKFKSLHYDVLYIHGSITVRARRHHTQQSQQSGKGRKDNYI